MKTSAKHFDLVVDP